MPIAVPQYRVGVDWTGDGSISDDDSIDALWPWTIDASPYGTDDYHALVMADAPSGYWRLGEASGTAAADASGNGRTGTVAGGVTLGQTGALADDSDKAMLFNGSTGYVSVPATGLKPTGALTLEALIYYAASADVAPDPIFLTQDATGNYLRSVHGVPLVSIRVGGVQTTIQGTSLPAAAWYHIAATWASGDRLRLYVGGVQVAQSASIISGTLDNSGSIVEIGRFSGSLYFKGRIDEAAIYPTAKSAARILVHAQAVTSTAGSIDGAPVVVSLDDVSADVRLTTPLQAAYGRDQAREYAPPAASKATYLLDNADGKYSSANSASPLFGLLNPGLLCQIQAILGGVTYGLHTGYLDAPSELPGIRQQLVSETSLDGLAKLKAAVISTAELVGVRIDVAIGACLDAAGWPASLRRLSVADTALARWCVDAVDAFAAIRDLTYTEGPGSSMYVDPLTGEFVWENRHYRLLTARCTSSQMTARAQGAEPVFGQDFGYDPGVRGIVNSCTVPVNSYAVAALGTIWTGPTSVTLAAGEVRSFQVTTIADWFTAAVAPVSGTDYTLTGTPLDGAVLSRTSGKRATLTLTAAAGGGCTITGLVVRGQTVTISRSYVSNTVSGASATGVDYGVRTFPAEFIPSWLPDVNTAQDFTNYVVGRYKDPVPTVRFVLNSMDDTRLAAALARTLSDRVTVIEPLRAHISSDFFVEQIQDVISMGGSHQRIFSCEQAAAGTFWVLGIAGYSELGVTTRLAF